MDYKKTTFLRALIIYDDIANYHNDLNKAEDWNQKLRLLKNCLIALDIFRDSFGYLSFLIKENTNLAETGRALRRRLSFINHLRNKISGHLDQDLLHKAVQWEPFIFSYNLKSNQEGRLILAYKTLLESGINSYIDQESRQKVFDTEIDLFYPPDQALFFNYIGELNKESLDFLQTILHKLENEIDHWTADQILEMAQKAGLTDFKLKK